MLKRSLVFMHPATLSLRNGQMVIIRKEIPDDNLTVPIEDIGLVMINHAMVSLTIPLLNALTEQNVAVIFCNEKGMPASMLYNLQGIFPCKQIVFFYCYAVKHDGTCIFFQKPCNDMQYGRFPRTRLTQQRDDFSVPNPQRTVLNGGCFFFPRIKRL